MTFKMNQTQMTKSFREIWTPKTIHEFVSDNANIKAIDNEGESALTYAIENEAPSLIKFIYQEGLNRNVFDELDSPIFTVLAKGNTILAGDLIRSGLSVNVCDASKKTPLHYGCEIANPWLVELCLENKAYINALDINGNTPLHIASSIQNSEIRLAILKILLGKGADYKIRNSQGELPDIPINIIEGLRG